MYFLVYFYTKSEIEREMEYSAKTMLPLNSNGIIYHLPLLPQTLNGMTLYSYLYYHLGERCKRALKVSIFGDLCQREKEY
jgi:hypothetical protein